MFALSDAKFKLNQCSMTDQHSHQKLDNRMSRNLDLATVVSFGDEWERFDQRQLSTEELDQLFNGYFGIFPWSDLAMDAEGFDLGCGSGRWARLVAPRVGKLNCIDASEKALDVSRRSLDGLSGVNFIHAPVDAIPLPSASQDFGYSLGVLHHIPDTAAALKSCTSLLKPGAPFLVYLYYRFDNRPRWFKLIWRSTEVLRAAVSSLPESVKPFVTDTIAALIYLPLARSARILEKLGVNPSFLPLSFYRNASFYTMRTDSRDRFGTPLEQRFTRIEVEAMMRNAGLDDIRFSESEPYWVAVGIKRP